MVHFTIFRCTDRQFGCEAFSMLVPKGWEVAGGIFWRQHATMPGYVNLSVKSPDGRYEMRILPSLPYFWNANPFNFFGPQAGSYYMGNEVRPPVSGYAEYLEKYVLPQTGYYWKTISCKPLPELVNALRQENPPGYGCMVNIDAGLLRAEVNAGGESYSLAITCGIVLNQMMAGQASWIADKIILVRTPMEENPEADAVFTAMLHSFRFDEKWFHYYLQYVQACTQYVMQDIYNAGIVSRIVSNTYNQISDMSRRSYELQQATYSRTCAAFSESIRGVNSYYDPYKGYDVELPGGYRYVYGNPLGDYIFTDDASYRPGVGSNLDWTILNQR